MPPAAPKTNIKKKVKSEINKAELLLTPTLAKKNTVRFSRKPSPPIEIGSRVMALIIGRNMKK